LFKYPLSVDQIILKVLSKEQTSRYRTADQFGRVLENLRETLKVNSPNGSSGLVEEISSFKENQDSKIVIEPKKNEENFDLKTALLALLAFLLAGGLIPFWLYIWFSLNTGR